MSYALLTAFLFAGAAICNTRISSIWDTIAANFWRLLIAACALGVLTFVTDPNSYHASGCLWLLLSGFIGFGIGDIGLFSAFARIGSRITVLINFCLGTVLGAIGDWMLLGDGIAPREWIAIFVVFAGLALALLGAERKGTRVGSFGAGLLFAVLGAFGQGFGATLSRQGRELALADGIEISGISQAFQRVLAGLACVMVVYLWRRVRGTLAKPQPGANRVVPWLLCAAMFGPVLGVSCFQQALSAMESSGLVMAVVAISPLLLIPLAYVFEGDKPTKASLAGAIIGVAGVIGIALLKT